MFKHGTPSDRSQIDGREAARLLYAGGQPPPEPPPSGEASPARCEDDERPRMAAYAAAHELGYTRAAYARDVLMGLFHGLLEARCGVGGDGHE